MDILIKYIVDESKWLTVSLGLAFLFVLIAHIKKRKAQLNSQKRYVLSLLNLCFSITIGFMAFGHLLAVTVKLLKGTLEGSMALFYLIGIVLAIPSWWLIYYAILMLRPEHSSKKSLPLNLWVAVTLLALGPYNFPLAAPAFLNMAYDLNKSKKIDWIIIVLIICIYTALFIGSLIFFINGQSFEQFKGIE